MKVLLMLIAVVFLFGTASGSEIAEVPSPSVGSENTRTVPNTTDDAAPVAAAAGDTLSADKILFEETQTNARVINNSLRGFPNATSNMRSTGSADAVVSDWLEERSTNSSRAIEAGARNGRVAKHSHSHSHYQDIEVDMGGGWCDLCGCWLAHGSDPNGTPASEIGHPNVCVGGSSSLTCWMHYYTYCYSS